MGPREKALEGPAHKETFWTRRGGVQRRRRPRRCARRLAAAGGGTRILAPWTPATIRTPRAHTVYRPACAAEAPRFPTLPPLRATHAWRPRRRARTTKQMESRMFDFPDPFRPVIALNFGSKRPITVRCAYDLKPSTMISIMRIVKREPAVVQVSRQNEIGFRKTHFSERKAPRPCTEPKL